MDSLPLVTFDPATVYFVNNCEELTPDCLDKDDDVIGKSEESPSSHTKSQNALWVAVCRLETELDEAETDAEVIKIIQNVLGRIQSEAMSHRLHAKIAEVVSKRRLITFLPEYAKLDLYFDHFIILYIEFEKKHRTLKDTWRNLIKQEVSQAEKETFFRLDSVYSKFFKQLFTEELEPLLNDVRSLLLKSLKKLKKEEELKLPDSSQFHLFCSGGLEGIYVLLKGLPWELRQILSFKHQTVEGKFPGKGGVIAEHLLFLRVIEPAIVQLALDQEGVKQKGLILFTKVLQKICSSSLFEVESEKPLNRIVEKFGPKHHKAISSLM